MNISLTVPEDIAQEFFALGEDPARVALIALALEGYRSKTLSEEQVRRMLDLESRLDVHKLLKQHGVFLNYTVQDLQQDIDSSVSLSSPQ
jgi:hypothetical protein